MKLYSANLSPFASRARLAIYAKGLPIEIAYPPGGGLKSPEYLAINPLGKAPCLETATGEGIPESYVILEYLEDAYPEPSLLKGTPEQRARRIRLIARIADLYVMGPAQALFGQLNPATRDPATLDGQLDKLAQGLTWVECYLSDTGYAAGADFSIADCMLAPALIWIPIMASLGRPELASANPKLTAYTERVKGHPAVAKVWAEMEKAIAHYQATGQLS